MNFSMIQSLGTYTKNMEMQIKWQRKKANNDFTADGSTKLKDPVAQQAEEIRMSQADGSSKLSSQIRAKLAAGKKLTREEMEYLQKNDPQTYQKATAIEEEQKSYEEELKRCKTKEDVQRVKMNHTAASLSVVNSVENNPAIPESAKLGIICQELQKCMALEEAISKFVESGQYAQLPTEAEKREAEEALEEAKAEELQTEDSTESTKESNTDNSELNTDCTKDNISDEESKDAPISESAQKGRVTLPEHKLTPAEAETTPEALKVKKAKVRAAYKESQIPVPEPMIDLKIR